METPTDPPRKRKFDSRLWLGQECLSGKTILLYAEGGFGDTIQFIRYKLFDPDVKLIIQCQVSLMNLSVIWDIREIIAPGDEPLPRLSLPDDEPTLVSTTSDTVPQFDRYIYAPYEYANLERIFESDNWR